MREMSLSKDGFIWFHTMTSRWRDNDIYGHINNAVFYEYVDTAVNVWLISSGALSVPRAETVGLVVHSECQFFAPLSFPAPVEAGVRVARVGRSSITYEVGLFGPHPAALARFTHVYVAKDTHRPAPLPQTLRDAAQALVIDPPEA